MKFLKWIAAITLLTIMGSVGVNSQAQADGSVDMSTPSGNFMIRILGSGVLPDEDAKPISTGGVPSATHDADLSDDYIPALTLTYFMNPNWSLELFCCFSKHDVKGTATLAAVGDLGDSWLFPPSVTLQYHFTNMGRIKPYVGAGVTFIHFFDEGVGSGAATALNVVDFEIDDAFGLALQAGVDISLGGKWYFNADVKKIWLNTDATWTQNTGTKIVSDLDIDPVIVSVGLGYRFNLSDIF